MTRLRLALIVATLAACGTLPVETNPCPQPGDPDFDGPGTYGNQETGERIECVGPER